jgi:hypothetical protein
MIIDITEQFRHKKAYVNSIEIQIKAVTLRFETEEIKDAEAKYIAVTEVLSRRGNTYNLEELMFPL